MGLSHNCSLHGGMSEVCENVSYQTTSNVLEASSIAENRACLLYLAYAIASDTRRAVFREEEFLDGVEPCTSDFLGGFEVTVILR